MSDAIPGTSKPTEAEVMREAFRAQVAMMHTAIPARVESYDHTTQKATVRPTVRFRRIVDDSVTGNKTFETYIAPAIGNVPVAFSKATGYADTWPLTVGDTGMVVFQERSTDEWRATANPDSDPADYRRFDLADAIFIPCQTSPADPIGASGIDAAARVLEAPTLLLGDSTATSFVALATAVLTELQAIKLAFDAHTHVGVTVGGGVSGVPSVLMPAPGSVAATKVKAK